MKCSDKSLNMLLARLSSGDKEAFYELYNTYAGKVYNFLNNISGNSILAQEITQEVFIKVWMKRQTFDPEQNFEAWLFVCAKNMFLNEIRLLGNKDKYKSDAVVLKNEEDHSTTEAIDYHFTEHQIAGIVEKMPQQRKKIFLLAKVYGLSVNEIAQRMGISSRTVESQLYQAKKFITSQIGELS